MNAVLQPQQEYSTQFSGKAVQPQRDQALFDAIEALRYQVYCEECGFLAPEDYPSKRETDEHDASAAHFAALNLSNELVGYVRLVFPDALENFPFQTHCVSILDNVILPPPAQSAEISRLMVHQRYRRRQGERPPAGIPSVETLAEPPFANEQRNPSPQIMLAMYRQMYVYSVNNNIRYWYAAMERSLARVLSRMNFGFQQIGPFTDYYGPVAPYVADLRVLEYQVSQRDPALLAWMRAPLAQS